MSEEQRRYPRRPLTAEIKQKLVGKFGAKCSLCGTESGPFEIAHILPLAYRGTNEESNLLLLCRNCSEINSSARPHEGEFVFYLAGLIKATAGFDTVQIESDYRER